MQGPGAASPAGDPPRTLIVRWKPAPANPLQRRAHAGQLCPHALGHALREQRVPFCRPPRESVGEGENEGLWGTKSAPEWDALERTDSHSAHPTCPPAESQATPARDWGAALELPCLRHHIGPRLRQACQPQGRGQPQRRPATRQPLPHTLAFRHQLLHKYFACQLQQQRVRLPLEDHNQGCQ